MVGARTQPGIVTQISHAGALPDRPVGQPDPEQLDPAVRASPGVVPIVAAMRTLPSHSDLDRIRLDVDGLG